MLWVCSKTIYSYMWSTPEPDVPSRERKTDESNDQTKYEALNNLNWIMLLLLDHYLTMINYFSARLSKRLSLKHPTSKIISQPGRMETITTKTMAGPINLRPHI